ncbi:hypothetical protein C8T65DRAFT_835039 [Cerioporus squamosus]|nr:hypothetical protein C8T65DRAFT_835039 [Cerioporus squamosus]
MTRLKIPRISLTPIFVLDGTVTSLEATKDAITAAAPVPGLGIALNVLIKLLKRIQEAKSNCDALVMLCQEATSLADTLNRLARTIKTELEKYPVGSHQGIEAQEKVSGSSSKLVGRVEELATDLGTICAEADKLSKRGHLGKFIYSTRDAEAIAGMKDRMAAACRRFQMEGNIAIEALAEEILRSVKVADEERILSRIPRADDAHYLAAANAAKARLQEGTREQVFTRLEEWEKRQFATKGAHPVCVLVGEAGTGKSTIAFEFSKRLQQRGRLGASFFFTRGVQDLNSPRKVFSTIASQLAQSQPALRGHIVDAAREHVKIAPLQQFEREFEDLIRRPLSAISSSKHAPIFVVVDALDECTEEGPELVPSLLRLLLSAAVEPGSPLCVFLTSRPEPHYIHRVFTTPELKPRISEIYIQEFRTSVDGDIECLIGAKLAEHETSKRWSEEDPSRLATLVQKSEGLFIYARTVVDFIIGDGDDQMFMQERYNILLTIEGSSTVLDPVDKLYHVVLDSVFPPRAQYPQMQHRLKRVLGYLVAVLEPDGISPRTLEKLTNMPTTESVPILNKLRSVVLFERDNVDSRFRIIHATFREFLADWSRSGRAFYVSAKQVHGLLADDCLSTMRSVRDQYWQGTAWSAVLLLRLLTEDLQEVAYAFTYRDHHASHRRSVPHALGNCQPIDEDDVSLISSVVSYVRNQNPVTMWDWIYGACERSRQSLLAGSKLGEGLSRMMKLLHDLGVPVKGTQIAAVTMILDIQGTGNRAIPEDATSDATCSSTRTPPELSPLDMLYRTVLEKVFQPQERDPQTQEHLKRILAYLAALQEPDGISPTTLEKLTGMPTAESVPILKKLRSVIFFERDDVDSPFQIIHTTFREFLVDPRRAGDVFHVSAEQAHRRLADECQLTLRSFREEYWQGKSGGAVLLALLTQDQQVLASLSHFIYACTYRDHHISLANIEPHDPGSCQPTGEDNLPPIPSFVSCVRQSSIQKQGIPDRRHVIGLIEGMNGTALKPRPDGSAWA